MIQRRYTYAALLLAAFAAACSADDAARSDARAEPDAVAPEAGEEDAPRSEDAAVELDAEFDADHAASDAAPNDAAGDTQAEAGPAPDANSAAAFPNADNTGPVLSQCPGGKLERYTGASDYRPKSGEVVACREFQNRAVYIAAEVSDVTIEHCLFTTSNDLFINVQGARVTVQDSEFRGPAGTWIRNSYNGDHLTVRRNDFSGMANAVEFNVGYEVVEDNYVHDFSTVSADQHADGLQTDGASHAVVRHNTVLLNNVAGATGAIALFGGDDILVERNKVAGGGYTIYPGGATSKDVRFLDNCFSTMFNPGKAQSGAYAPWYLRTRDG